MIYWLAKRLNYCIYMAEAFLERGEFVFTEFSASEKRSIFAKWEQSTIWIGYQHLLRFCRFSFDGLPLKAYFMIPYPYLIIIAVAEEVICYLQKGTSSLLFFDSFSFDCNTSRDSPLLFFFCLVSAVRFPHDRCFISSPALLGFKVFSFMWSNDCVWFCTHCILYRSRWSWKWSRLIVHTNILHFQK